MSNSISQEWNKYSLIRCVLRVSLKIKSNFFTIWVTCPTILSKSNSSKRIHLIFQRFCIGLPRCNWFSFCQECIAICIQRAIRTFRLLTWVKKINSHNNRTIFFNDFFDTFDTVTISIHKFFANCVWFICATSTNKTSGHIWT